MRKSADFARVIALCTPISSTSSDVSLSPAVSSSVTGKPLISHLTSTISRVVPATAVTIAASELLRAFKSDDFPAFGSPTNATSNPVFNRATDLTVSSSAETLSITPERSIETSRETSSGTSSSAKSIVASTRAMARNKSRRHPSTRRDTSPSRTRMA